MTARDLPRTCSRPPQARQITGPARRKAGPAGGQRRGSRLPGRESQIRGPGLSGSGTFAVTQITHRVSSGAPSAASVASRLPPVGGSRATIADQEITRLVSHSSATERGTSASPVTCSAGIVTSMHGGWLWACWRGHRECRATLARRVMASGAGDLHVVSTPSPSLLRT